MPVVVGSSQDAATTALKAAGLALGTITPKNDQNLIAGIVISADQTAGSQVATGTAVNLVVASGRVTINDVTGYTVDAAKRQLQDLGLAVTTTPDATCKAVSPPTVESQSLAPGDVPIHSAITLTFCSGQ
jgi:serine/threonine-protein kinase